MLELANFGGALISDALSAISSPIASLGGSALSSALSKLVEKRQAIARELLLEEISHGGTAPNVEDIDESASILYRYLRAAQEGAGRVNLRLLAAVYAGQVRDRAIVADEFLYYADLLAALRRDEIILLGSFLRHSTTIDGSPRLGHEPMYSTRQELVPDVFPAPEDFLATLGALLRTGLVAADTVGGAIGGGSSMVYRATNLLRKLNRLATIEQVIGRET